MTPHCGMPHRHVSGDDNKHKLYRQDDAKQPAPVRAAFKRITVVATHAAVVPFTDM